MDFEPKRTAETLGTYAGFAFSFLLASAVVTTLYALTHHAWQYWLPAFRYFMVVVCIVMLIGLSVKRMLR
jgi:hypothetical protein